jgi:hypothetical protein
VDLEKLLTASRVKGIPPHDVDKYFLVAYASFPSEIERWMVPEEKVVLNRFGLNKDELTNSHLAEIERIARLVVMRESSAQPIRTIRLLGHTDPVGKGSYNINLGLRRALAVQSALRRAIDDAKPGLAPRIVFVVESLGEEAPVADNKTEDGRAQNRRVEVCLSRLGKGHALAGRLQRVPIESVVERGLRLLKDPPRAGVQLTDGQTRRISCFLRKVLPMDADDRFVDGPMVIRVYNTGRPQPEFLYLKDWLTAKDFFGSAADDAAFVRRLQELDGRIIEGIAKLDQEITRIEGAMGVLPVPSGVPDPGGVLGVPSGVAIPNGLKQLRMWMLDRMKQDVSIYSCYTSKYFGGG